MSDIAEVRVNSVYQMIVTIVPVVFALLHFLLFVFYRRLKANLYYAIFTASIAATEFLVYQQVYGFVTSAAQAHLFDVISDLLSFPLLLFGLLFLYSLIFEKTPKQFWIFLGVGLILGTWISLDQEKTSTIFLLYAFAALLEMLRIVGIALLRKKEGAWILAAGFVGFITSGCLLIFHAAGVLDSAIFFHLFWTVGILGLIVSMSVYLSRSFAKTNQDLQKQLIEVKALSEKALQQEREAKKRDIERELLKAENERKTKELEEARQLQLCMLPRSEPSLPNYEIAAAMRTANEVGGDYYDFVLAEDGTLTVAIGDATGHGTRAGMMVTSIKTLFSSVTAGTDIIDFFHASTKVIRGMRLGNLYMAMTVAQFKDHKMLTSAAGMPPILIYRAASNKIEEIILKGMPLGGPPEFPYQQQEVNLKAGDTVLMMTDGFEELFNERKETLDYSRVKISFAQAANQSAQGIVSHLFSTASKWRHNAPQNDDITFVVVKVVH